MGTLQFWRMLFYCHNSWSGDGIRKQWESTSFKVTIFPYLWIVNHHTSRFTGHNVYSYIIRIKHLEYLWKLDLYNLAFNIVSPDREWALHRLALAFNLRINSNLPNQAYAWTLIRQWESKHQHNAPSAIWNRHLRIHSESEQWSLGSEVPSQNGVFFFDSHRHTYPLYSIIRVSKKI